MPCICPDSTTGAGLRVSVVKAPLYMIIMYLITINRLISHNYWTRVFPKERVYPIVRHASLVRVGDFILFTILFKGTATKHSTNAIDFEIKVILTYYLYRESNHCPLD